VDRHLIIEVSAQAQTTQLPSSHNARKCPKKYTLSALLPNIFAIPIQRPVIPRSAGQDPGGIQSCLPGQEAIPARSSRFARLSTEPTCP
jgi:hypothetical protein